MSDAPTPPTTGREWQLLSRPVGWPKPEDFALVEAEVRPPGEGRVLVRNEYLSADPYMRGLRSGDQGRSRTPQDTLSSEGRRGGP